SQYVVHWGDGHSDTYATAGPRTHAYADGPATYAITVDLADEDGTHADRANPLSVAVADVAPRVDAGGDALLREGGRLVRAGSFTDPGADTWAATVDYGDGQGPRPLALAGHSFVLDHAYAAAGTYTVT